MSRSQAKDLVDMQEFEESMNGIYSSSVCTSTIDEAPMVYKPMAEIMENIKDTVDIIDVIRPVYNFKTHRYRCISGLFNKEEENYVS